MSEDAKIAIRNIRRDEMEAAKAKLKANEVSEDEEKGMEDKIQKATDKFVAKIDEMTDQKEESIMKV